MLLFFYVLFMLNDVHANINQGLELGLVMQNSKYAM